MNKHECKAYQASDQMFCRDCELVWDVSDPEPPECKKPHATMVHQALTDAFESIVTDNDPLNKKCVVAPMSLDQLRASLSLPEGFYASFRNRAVTVVQEKLSPLTDEKLVSIFFKDGTPDCQIRKTMRSKIVTVEIRKYLEYKRNWAPWSNF